MTFLVSPSEPLRLRNEGATSPITEEYGADVLIPAHGYFIGVQRKQFPDDYLGSLHDGRLGDSLIKLTKCQLRFLICEGTPRWDRDGELIGHQFGSTFTYRQLVGLTLSAFSELGVMTIWTRDLPDTIKLLHTIETWGRKEEHNSLFSRPGMPKVDGKREYSKKDRAMHILQGFDAIGPKLASNIFDEFGRLPFTLSAEDEERLNKVPRMGPKKVKKLKDVMT